MNQAGSTLTETPFGGSTALTYVSGLLATFLTTLCVTRVPDSAVIVTEGWFRSDGLLNDPPHVPPVAILIVSGSVLGREHRKLR